MLNLSKERIRKTDTDRMSADSGKGTGEPNIENMKLGEARKFELAILHIDINDFKNKTRALKNEQYLRLVSTYLTEMTRIINENEGLVDRYVGDQVTALFGIGHNCSSCNPKDCLKCALNMQTVIKYSMNDFLILVILIILGIIFLALLLISNYVIHL
jgi:class 3 adenylate cyclase